MKNSLVKFAKDLGVKGSLTVLFLLAALGVVIWLAAAGSIDVFRGQSTRNSVWLGFMLVLTGTVIACDALTEKSGYWSTEGRRRTVLLGVLVLLLGVTVGIRVNQLPDVLLLGLGVGLLLTLSFVLRRRAKIRRK